MYLQLPLEILAHIHLFSDIDTKLALQRALPAFRFKRYKIHVPELFQLRLDFLNIIKSCRYEINSLILSLRHINQSIAD